MTPNQRLVVSRPVQEAVRVVGTPTVTEAGSGETLALPALVYGTTKLLIA